MAKHGTFELLMSNFYYSQVVKFVSLKQGNKMWSNLIKAKQWTKKETIFWNLFLFVISNIVADIGPLEKLWIFNFICLLSSLTTKLLTNKADLDQLVWQQQCCKPGSLASSNKNKCIIRYSRWLCFV